MAKSASHPFLIDRRDIRFVLWEYLRAQKLTGLPAFAGFNQELLEMAVEEGITFAQEVFAPLNTSGDLEGLRMEGGQVATPAGFKQAWKAAAEGGWLSITDPAEYGGQGLPASVGMAVKEALFGANPSLYITTMLTSGASGLITHFGTPEQIELYATRMISGEWGGTMCLSEAQAGSAVGEALTKAVKAPQGDGYLILGTKQWISGGGHDLTPNNIHLVLARPEGAPAGTKGLSLFIVPAVLPGPDGRLGEANGVSVVRLEHKLGIKASPTCVLDFGGQKECLGWMLGQPGQGMAQMFKLMNEARLIIGAQGLATGGGAFQFALNYAHERLQGPPIEQGRGQTGNSPIVNHPDVRWMLMNMKALVEGLRGLIYALAYYDDLAKYGPKAEREGWHDLVDILTPVAKNAGSDLGFEVVRQAIQVLGGVGYTEEFPLAQALRDTKIASIYEGTNGIQGLDLATRKLTLHNGRLYQRLLAHWQPLTPQQARGASLRQAIEAWAQAKANLEQTVGRVAATAAELGPRQAVLNATDLTQAFGGVEMGFQLLSMALLAEEKLAALNPPAEEAALAAFLAETSEARFFHNKIQTAEHFSFQWLPRLMVAHPIIAANNFAALKAVL